MTTASNTAGATQAAVPTTTGSTNNNQASIIIVEVVGYGGGDGSEKQSSPNDGSRSKEQGPRSDTAPVYNPNGPVRILGVGSLTDDQKKSFSEEEKGKL